MSDENYVSINKIYSQPESELYVVKLYDRRAGEHDPYASKRTINLSVTSVTTVGSPSYGIHDLTSGGVAFYDGFRDRLWLFNDRPEMMDFISNREEYASVAKALMTDFPEVYSSLLPESNVIS
jgi:hypothetical protein